MRYWLDYLGFMSNLAKQSKVRPVLYRSDAPVVALWIYAAHKKPFLVCMRLPVWATTEFTTC